ncbi:MAG: putative RNA uridine N3 methyltransferase, partial [Candidatus Caldarchaeum sp.]
RMRGGRVCVAFGAADRGLRQIAEELELDLGTLFDVAVNFAPGQGVKTIRTEEALAYTLAILNLISL